MQTIQQGSGVGRTDKSDASDEQRAGPSESASTNSTAPNGVPPRPKRWVPHRKAEIVSAVRGGFLSLDDACERYALSVEEYLSWQRAIELHGLAGLCVSKTHQRRHGTSHPADYRQEDRCNRDAENHPSRNR